MKKNHILFLCTGNACRSQIAEGFAHHYSGNEMIVSSAGIVAHGKNPRAIATMKEIGIDISSQESTAVTDEMINMATIIVTVCGNADEHCPVIPSHIKKYHWPLEDPAKAKGTEEEINQVFSQARDDIKKRVLILLSEVNYIESERKNVEVA